MCHRKKLILCSAKAEKIGHVRLSFLSPGDPVVQFSIGGGRYVTVQRAITEEDEAEIFTFLGRHYDKEKYESRLLAQHG